MKRVLVVDDDRSVAPIVRRAISKLSVEVVAMTSAEDALKLLSQSEPDVLMLDLVLPKMSGLEALMHIRPLHPRLPVIFMTGSGNSDTAIEVTKEGVQDYLRKPLNLEAIEKSVRRALATTRFIPEDDHESDHIVPRDHGDAIVGHSAKMQEVLRAIGRVANQDVSVLVRGESGTGKELVARAIYRHSERAHKPFLTVNCAALSETHLESELFGNEEGGSTGTTTRLAGKFERCTSGTILLDEIGDMAASVQAKVLRLLQQQQFERLAQDETLETNVRIIATTNRDLESKCTAGRFRADLFHRLNGYTIDVPPLRERGDDVKLLLEHFLAKYNHQLAKDKDGIDPEAARALCTYHWPGNIRELQAVLCKAMLDASTPIITCDLLPEEIRQGKGPRRETFVRSFHDAKAVQITHGELRQKSEPPDIMEQFAELVVDERERDLYAFSIEMMERHLLLRVLEVAQGNRTKAATMLGITRSSLRNKMRALGITVGPTSIVCGNGEVEDDASVASTLRD